MTRPFRCERCGYDLSGVSEAALCQECGTPVNDSRPERRPGIPWQHSPTPPGLLATLRMYVTTPIGIYRAVRIETRSMGRLLVVNLGLSLIIGLVPSAVVAIVGRRDLITTVTSGVTHRLADPLPPVLFVLNSLVIPIALVTVWVIARFIAPRQKPPLARAVTWCSAGISSSAAVIGTTVAVLLWSLRYATIPEETLPLGASTGYYHLMTAAPLLAYLGILCASGVLDAYANRHNRLANSLDPTP